MILANLHGACYNYPNVWKNTYYILGIGECNMTPEGFLFVFFGFIILLCIIVVVVVSSTVATTVAAVVADEESLEEE